MTESDVAVRAPVAEALPNALLTLAPSRPPFKTRGREESQRWAINSPDCVSNFAVGRVRLIERDRPGLQLSIAAIVETHFGGYFRRSAPLLCKFHLAPMLCYEHCQTAVDQHT